MRVARIERLVSFVVGVIGVLALRAPLPALSPPLVRSPLPLPLPLPLPSPIVTPVMLPTVVAAIPATALADCPLPPLADDAPIGRTATTAELGNGYDAPPPGFAIAASARAPVIALVELGSGAVRASFDDGRHFAPIFDGKGAISIAVDDAGRIYALSYDALGVRDARGHERWRPFTCTHDRCVDRIVPIGDDVAWLHDGALLRSHDGGLHWHATAAATDDVAEIARQDRVLAWHGRLYGITHSEEDCGWVADVVAHVDLSGRNFAEETFNNEDAAPQLDLVDDGGATWRYLARGAHGARIADDLLLGRLAPAVGARELRVDGTQLVELCGTRARAVAHTFGADHIDAVDAAGRPLLVRGELVLRWSPRWGWRALATGVPEPVVTDGD